MKRNTGRIDDLERRLYAAHWSRECPPLRGNWRDAVMREIRLAGVADSAGADRLLIGRFAWRFSAAACLVALLLLAYVFSSGFVDYQELAMRFFENPIEFII
jgi:hypothetical protein